MKIAITGARGNVGREVVKACAEAGHETVQIDRIGSTEHDGSPNANIHVADVSARFEHVLDAFKGCEAVIHLAAISYPLGVPESLVHGNNTQAAFNGFRACGELGIKRICYASSVNAIGLVFSNQPYTFKYFPIDEEYPPNPTDGYALAKLEAEMQARCFANWFPGTKIASLRIHQVIEREKAVIQHDTEEGANGLENLWCHVEPKATAQACLLAVEKADNFEGAQIFNIVGPQTTSNMSSKELAQKYHPEAEIREGLEGNNAFWSTAKAERILGWKHDA